MSQHNILLVEDHDLVRQGIISLFEGNPHFDITHEAADGDGTLSILNNQGDRINIVITDISLGEGSIDGIELTKRIRESYPDIKVIALTMIKESQYIKRMFEAGASAYLLKNSGKNELFRALEKVVAGGIFWSEEVAGLVMEYMTRRSRDSRSHVFENLSARELEVLKLILKEFDNTRIAEELSISPRTVEVHKHNLLEKTGSKNMAGLVLYAVRSGLINSE